ncbi:MAG: hypothetical protein HUK22_03575, partial [Thermoguttaceae bacterium]|nr:hypothetical protein [Thermoguttaceae bacterium]
PALAADAMGLYDSAFVGTAGVVDSGARSGVAAANYARPKTEPTAKRRYYDPERNNYVSVAYQAEGAVLPSSSDDAPVFGDGLVADAVPQGVPFAQRPTSVSEDDLLEIVAYSCLPSQIDQVEELARRQFAANPEIAFSVDRFAGTIVVHTNRRMQRAVKAYFATGKIYPVNRAADPNQFDPRLATGATRRLDGSDLSEPSGLQATRQAFGVPAETIGVAGSTNDVYRPQYRGAAELKIALAQLFGAKFQRVASEVAADAPYSQRQIEAYRFVKRMTKGETARRDCIVQFDELNNAISLDGDAAICAEMQILLETMDRPPVQNGLVRRFIPLENGDPRKIRQIFEYGKQTPASTPGLGLRRDPFGLGNELARLDLPSAELPLVQRFAPIFTDVASAPSECVAVRAQNSAKNPIAQVSYQEGDLSSLGDDGSAGLGGFDSQYDSLSSDRRYGRFPGVGVVQGFTPTVLDNLDVVIVDGATDAEFERIRQMIEQIEELAKIAEPIIEVYNLKYVDGAMLHGVLTRLYQEMFATKQGRVMFYALQTPNALLVVGWGQAFEDMKNLIEVFDKPIADGGGTLRVVRLQYASATEVAATLEETFVRPLTDGTGGLAPRIRAFSDARTNSLIIQASPNDWDQVQELLVELDVNKVSTKLSTRVFPLKNSLATDLQATIMQVILPAKQGTLETTAAKFPMLELLSVDDSGRKLVESGV